MHAVSSWMSQLTIMAVRFAY